MHLPAALVLLAAHCLAAVTPDPPPDPLPDPAPNDWRMLMLALVNSARAAADRPPLALDSRVNKLAQRHSEYQASIDQMTHDDPDGSLGDRATRLGIRWSALAENVAVGSRTVEETVELWIDSPQHYANIIGPYELVGFGRAANTSAQHKTIYWTQEFVRPLT
ncbi:hypothetical protein LPJ73_002788 [Coemansia sp. RSA 2703]|nr:hypothetical protein LPJ73_002788 [Coemansia sp. RSA 2703]